MKRYKLLLADADDTLFDFHLAEGKAFRHACAAMGIVADGASEILYRRINASLWRAYERKEIAQEELRVRRFSRFLEEAGLTADAEAMADAFISGLSLQRDEIPGARDLAREVSARGIAIVIVTNGIASVQRSRFSKSPLSAWVRGMVISGEVGFAKPDPRMVERGLQIAGVSAEEALMLGDDPGSDIKAANAAGVDSCWFNPSGRENTAGSVSTYEIRALPELLEILPA